MNLGMEIPVCQKRLIKWKRQNPLYISYLLIHNIRFFFQSKQQKASVYIGVESNDGSISICLSRVSYTVICDVDGYTLRYSVTPVSHKQCQLDR